MQQILDLLLDIASRCWTFPFYYIIYSREKCKISFYFSNRINFKTLAI